MEQRDRADVIGRRWTRSLALAVLAACVLPWLGGCIVWDIRDELRAANGQLTQVQASLEKLDQTNEALDRTNQGLDRTNAIIDNVERGLGRIDTTNSSLTDLERQLVLLQSIETSLGRLDGHLASLRRTIGRIDSVMPFLDLGGGEPVTDAFDPSVAIASAGTPEGQVEAPAGAAGAAGGAADGAASGAASGAPAPGPSREPMLGTWLSRSPDDRAVLVVLADGRYLYRRGPGEPVEEGSWSRSDRVLTLRGNEVEIRQADGTTTRGPGPVRAIETVSAAGRSITVKVDGDLWVLTRP